MTSICSKRPICHISCSNPPALGTKSIFREYTAVPPSVPPVGWRQSIMPKGYAIKSSLPPAKHRVFFNYTSERDTVASVIASRFS